MVTVEKGLYYGKRELYKIKKNILPLLEPGSGLEPGPIHYE